jgi:hypothetical protein
VTSWLDILKMVPPVPSDLVTAYVGLGSNLGDRSRNLQGAIDRLGKVGIITAVSSIYQTKPWMVDGINRNNLVEISRLITIHRPRLRLIYRTDGSDNTNLPKPINRALKISRSIP